MVLGVSTIPVTLCCPGVFSTMTIWRCDVRWLPPSFLLHHYCYYIQRFKLVDYIKILTLALAENLTGLL